MAAEDREAGTFTETWGADAVCSVVFAERFQVNQPVAPAMAIAAINTIGLEIPIDFSLSGHGYFMFDIGGLSADFGPLNVRQALISGYRSVVSGNLFLGGNFNNLRREDVG